jgi:chitinase
MNVICRTAVAALIFVLVSMNTMHAQDRIVAYVPNWIDLPAFAGKIDYGKVTLLNLAFENPKDDQGNMSFERGDEALLTAAHAHHVPVLLSIGGGSASEDKAIAKRYATLLDGTHRKAFVARLADFVNQHGFDGVDVDLEGPAISPDYGAFVADLAATLKPSGKLLTAALSQGYGGDKVPDSVFAQFDFVNVMAYDATGPWDPKNPGQHSSLEFAQSSVRYWLDRGLPKARAVLGVPFFGYGFGPAFRTDDYSYKEIVTKYPGAEDADQAGKTIWYNGRPMMKAKAAFVKESGLAGIMIWELTQDAPGDRSLLSTIYDTLHSK